MGGLRKLCRMYGRFQSGGKIYVWDYSAEEPVEEAKMPVGSDRWRESEQARWAKMVEDI